MTKSMKKLQKLFVVALLLTMITTIHVPVSAASYTPRGYLDHMVMNSKGTSVNIAGWADIPYSGMYTVDIRVYFDNTYCGHLYANKYRLDVHKACNNGLYHGFSGDISLPKAGVGKHTVYVYAYNMQKGSNILLGKKTYNYVAANPIKSPVSNYRVTQSFGNYYSVMARKGRPYHSGVDMVSNQKTIYSASSGRVVYTGFSAGNGNHIVIQSTINGKTVKLLYSHLSRIYVKSGSTVSAGTSIGYMGNTGNSTGTHLHFAVMSSNASNDPLGYVARKSGSSNVITYNGVTYYNPIYVIQNGKLPQ